MHNDKIFIFAIFRNGRKVTKIETTTIDAQGNKKVETKTEEEEVGSNRNGMNKQIGKSYDPFDDFEDDDDFGNFGFLSSNSKANKKNGLRKQLK
jgi:hypothetical protein